MAEIRDPKDGIIYTGVQLFTSSPMKVGKWLTGKKTGGGFALIMGVSETMIGRNAEIIRPSFCCFHPLSSSCLTGRGFEEGKTKGYSELNQPKRPFLLRALGTDGVICMNLSGLDRFGSYRDISTLLLPGELAVTVLTGRMTKFKSVLMTTVEISVSLRGHLALLCNLILIFAMIGQLHPSVNIAILTQKAI